MRPSEPASKMLSVSSVSALVNMLLQIRQGTIAVVSQNCLQYMFQR